MRARRNEAMRFAQAAASCTATACLTWPFAVSAGRAMVRYDGNTRPASRFICQIAKGPPPTSRHEAAHSCGRGSEGCVNGSHLDWKTPKENHADMVEHGTYMARETHPGARITEADVERIRSLRGCTTQASIAALFGISKGHVGNIQRNSRWRE